MSRLYLTKYQYKHTIKIVWFFDNLRRDDERTTETRKTFWKKSLG